MQITVFLNLPSLPAFHRYRVYGRAQIWHAAPACSLIMRVYGLSPKHVSHKHGKALSSMPTFEGSAFTRSMARAQQTKHKCAAGGSGASRPVVQPCAYPRLWRSAFGGHPRPWLLCIAARVPSCTGVRSFSRACVRAPPPARSVRKSTGVRHLHATYNIQHARASTMGCCAASATATPRGGHRHGRRVTLWHGSAAPVGRACARQHCHACTYSHCPCVQASCYWHFFIQAL